MNKTIYVRKSDLEVWERAAQLPTTGKGLGPLLMDLLRNHLDGLTVVETETQARITSLEARFDAFVRSCKP